MRRNRNAHDALWIAGGVVAGAALGWMTAPRPGAWVRNQTRQKLGHWTRMAERRLYKASRDVENRAKGAAAEWKEKLHPETHYVDANTLVDQVHSRIGRQFAEILEHANLNAVDHIIYLHGYVPSELDRERLVAAIREVPGVGSVRAEELYIHNQRHTA